MNLLVVEDDSRVADFLVRGLRAEGYRVQALKTGEEALALARQQPPALILLDVMLPGISGMEVCQQLRAARIATPVLMLTAMGTVQDRVAGLRCGADDYLTKPFAFEELLARIEALLRRSRATASETAARATRPGWPAIFRLGVAEIDRSKFTVRVNGAEHPLTVRELRLAEVFADRPGQVLSRDELLNAVWGVNYFGTTRTLDQHVAQLRKKIDPPGQETSAIVTVHGVGYRLEQPSAAGEARGDR